MGNYINRDEFVTVRDDVLGASTLHIKTRMVGKTAMIEITEFAPELAKPASASKLAGIVRAESKSHVKRGRAVGNPMTDNTVVSELAHLDENGHKVTERERVRVLTYAVSPR